MKTTFKVIKARNKKYNNKIFTVENCKIVADVIRFENFDFNNKKYSGNIYKTNATMYSGNQSTIQFDVIEILN